MTTHATTPHAEDQPALTPHARELITIARQEGWAGAERSLQLVDPDTREALIRGGWARETERGRLLWTEEAPRMEVPAEGRAGVRRPFRESDHNLVISIGDEELHGECSCLGEEFGYIRPDQSLDLFAVKWDRHLTYELQRTGRQPA